MGDTTMREKHGLLICRVAFYVVIIVAAVL